MNRSQSDGLASVKSRSDRSSLSIIVGSASPLLRAAFTQRSPHLDCQRLPPTFPGPHAPATVLAWAPSADRRLPARGLLTHYRIPPRCSSFTRP